MCFFLSDNHILVLVGQLLGLSPPTLGRSQLEESVKHNPRRNHRQIVVALTSPLYSKKPICFKMEELISRLASTWRVFSLPEYLGQQRGGVLKGNC